MKKLSYKNLPILEALCKHGVTLLGAIVLMCLFLACSEEKPLLAPELSNTIVDLRGDTLHITSLSERDYAYIIEANAEGVITKAGKWERIGVNRFSGNIILWVCDQIYDLDESNRIAKSVFDGKIINTGLPKRTEYAFTYDDNRLSSVKSTTFENGVETSSYESHFTWADGNLLEMVRETTFVSSDNDGQDDGQPTRYTFKEVYKYSYSKKENPLNIFFTMYAFSICEYYKIWGEFGYYGMGTKNLPVAERVYQVNEDEKGEHLQLISTKKINIELRPNGTCQSLTYQPDDEKAHKVTYIYE